MTKYSSELVGIAHITTCAAHVRVRADSQRERVGLRDLENKRREKMMFVGLLVVTQGKVTTAKSSVVWVYIMGAVPVG